MNCPKCGAPLAPGSGFCSGCGSQVAVAGVPAKKSSAATAVIVALAVGFGAIFVIGIVAAIAIPNLLSSIQRGKQKRSMAELKMISTAVEAYRTDFNRYPAATNLDELCKALTPDYLATCIRKDGWTSPEHPTEIAYAAWGGTPEGCPAAGTGDAPGAAPPAGPEGGAPGAPACGPAHFGLASAGKDGKFAAGDFSGYNAGDTNSYDEDIVIMDGQFFRAPSGAQRNQPTHDAYGRPPGPAPEEFVPQR